MTDTVIIDDGEYCIIKRGDQIIRICGCCGKRLTHKAAVSLLNKINSGQFPWEVVYMAGLAYEKIGREL